MGRPSWNRDWIHPHNPTAKQLKLTAAAHPLWRCAPLANAGDHELVKRDVGILMVMVPLVVNYDIITMVNDA